MDQHLDIINTYLKQLIEEEKNSIKKLTDILNFIAVE